MLPETLKWADGALRLIDQRKLPDRLEYIDCVSVADVCCAIKSLAVRGAPAIGIAAAYGAAIGAREDRSRMEEFIRALEATRPTARNLFAATERMRSVASAAEDLSDADFAGRMLAEAMAIHDEDAECCRRIGQFGAALLRDGMSVITICNAGALATGGIGTSLGLLRAARDEGKRMKVFVCETRPVLQGARLTAWELSRDGFDVTLITDSMAAALMRTRGIGAVLAGADRIAANGDTANKIGTYSLAVLASHHEVPFIVAAPSGTIDSSMSDGASIPIEERPGDEIRALPGGLRVPDDIKVWNPSFDVTPAQYITRIVTERGIFSAPYVFR